VHQGTKSGAEYEYIYIYMFIFILGTVYNNKKENWRILTNKEKYAFVKNLP
jgi:hypothetical protein